MQRHALLGKIHQATVTECNPDYSGSITIDPVLLEATGMLPNEKVLVADCENGNRFETYIFRGEPGSGAIGVNGAASALTDVGHRVIVIAFCTLSHEEMLDHRPRVAICSADNSISELIEYDPAGMALGV